jgi:hypothetical protein
MGFNSPQEQIAEYKRLFPNNSEYDAHYSAWCAEQYFIFIKEKLAEYSQRNDDFLKKIDGLDAYNWMIAQLNSKPATMSREADGDALFNKILSCMGVYNSLSIELTRDALDEEAINYFIDRIKQIRAK